MTGKLVFLKTNFSKLENYLNTPNTRYIQSILPYTKYYTINTTYTKYIQSILPILDIYDQYSLY